MRTPFSILSLSTTLAACATSADLGPVETQVVEDECDALGRHVETCSPDHVEEIVAACRAHEDVADRVTAFCSGRADWFGNRGISSPCTWNWQCDAPLACRSMESSEGMTRVCFPLGASAPPRLWKAYFEGHQEVDPSFVCLADDDCRSGDCTRGGFCRAREGFERCVDAEDPVALCREALGPLATCLSGVCVTGGLCSGDAGCGPGHRCNLSPHIVDRVGAGYCSRADLAPGTCHTWIDCAENETCSTDWWSGPGICLR